MAPLAPSAPLDPAGPALPWRHEKVNMFIAMSQASVIQDTKNWSVIVSSP